MSIQFAAIGLNHNHIYLMSDQLIRAGAQLTRFYAVEPALIAAFQQRYPQAQPAESVGQILDDDAIKLVVSAAIPDGRAPLGIAVMRHGKDFVADKPGFTTLAQLEDVRRALAETGRIYSVYFSERFNSPATVKAGELVGQGAIGRVLQVTGFGPHQLGVVPRPEWFFRQRHFGGILNDLACHQVDQFLHFTGSSAAEVVAAQVANFNHPQYPELDDYGDMILRSGAATGYIRVDWFTPDGLGTWGDVRLFVLGTAGYLEIRKNIDLAGRADGDHLFLADNDGVHYIDCRDVHLPYGEQIIHDVLHRTETAMGQAHCFLASQLALQAQARAQRIAAPETR